MRPDGSYFYQDGDKEINVTPLNTTMSENPADWNYTDESGKIYTPHKLVQPQAELSQTSEDQLRYQQMMDNWRNSTSYQIADRIAEFGDPVAAYNNIQSGRYGAGALAALGMLAGPEDLLKTGARKIFNKAVRYIPLPVSEQRVNQMFEFVPRADFSTNVLERRPVVDYTDEISKSDLGTYITEGGESEVFENAGFPGQLLKEKGGVIKTAQDFEDLQDFVNHDLMQNRLPGALPLRYEGYTHEPVVERLAGRNGVITRRRDIFKPVYSQKKVDVTDEIADPWHTIFKDRENWELSDAYIQQLKDLGYIPNGRGYYNVKGFPYEIGDLGPNNTGYDAGGNFVIFDPLIHWNAGKDSGIHIKPENRGKFTRLKKRTGKSASWFKAHGTPAQKKMAVFALNSRKWSHKK